jgi:palmitoyl transferase
MSLFNFRKFIPFLALTALLTSVSSTAPAQETSGTTKATATSAATADTEAGWWDQAKAGSMNIVDHGALSIILSGYARHGRNTYTAERIAELNENAWGLGFSKAVRNQKDNEDSLFGLAISDSHFKPQFMAGYAHQWMQPIGGNFEAGVGYTALLISRTDYFSGIPFPGVLPVASIGTRNSKLMAAYIPRLSQNKGNGDVLLLFLRLDLN